MTTTTGRRPEFCFKRAQGYVALQRRGCWRWVAGDVLSTFQCLGASSGSCVRGGDMAGGSELSGSVAGAVRGRDRQRGEREMTEGLTGVRTMVSASSGTNWRRGAVAGDLGRPRLKK